MLHKRIYISFLILLTCVVAKAQLPPWTVTPTTNSQTIVLEKIDSSIVYDNSFNTIGDAIGVFYDQGGTWVCAGFLQLDGVTNSFTIYGNDAVDNGFQFNEMFHLEFWRKSKNCVVPNTFGGMSNAQYSTGGSDTIYVIGALPAVVEYPKDYYCKFDLAAIPVTMQITGTSFANINFGTIPAGFNNGYNPINGNIESFGLIPSGTYQLNMTTLDNMCLQHDSIVVTISNNLVSNPAIVKTQPDCLEPLGTIDLDTATILRGTKPYALSLVNRKTDASVGSASGLFKNVSVANYYLIVQDQNMCADSFEVSIKANPVNCDEEHDVITPNSSNSFSQVFLPWTGETKIYNSQGMLENTFTTPAVWDGKNQAGQLVKTGLYIIFTDGEKKKEITVVY